MRFMMFMYPEIEEKSSEWSLTPRRSRRWAATTRSCAGRDAALARRPAPARSDGATVGFDAEGAATVTDGPFAEAKEVVGGYWLIQARSKEEAVEWAQRCPGAGLPDRGAAGAGDGGLPAGRAGGGCEGRRRVSGDAPRPSGRSRRSGGSSRPASSPAWRGWCGDVGLAEDLAQDALVAALERWPRDGVPDNPGAWLMATAKNRAIDLIRRDADPRAQAGGAGPRGRAAARAPSRSEFDLAAERRGRRRPAGADLHLLPPGPPARGAGGADPAAARRPHRGRRSPAPSSPRSRRSRSGWCGRSGPCARPACRLRGAARRGARRAPALGARSDLPDLQRGLRGERRRGLDPAGALRGSAAARPRPRRAGAGGAGGARADRAAGDPGLAAARRGSAPAASRCCCSTRTARAGTRC